MSLRNSSKILDMADKACRVIISCENDKHINTAFTYVGLINKELKSMKHVKAADGLNSLYRLIKQHSIIMWRQAQWVQDRNRRWVKNYDKVKLAILHKK